MADKVPSVLIVDDEPAHIEAIRRAFAAAGPEFTVKSAATLRQYRELAAAEPPDIALLDLNLPDGCAVEAMSSLATANPFPILIMTSHGDEARAVQAMKAGALDYIVKSPEAFADMPRAVARARREWKLIQEHIAAERSLRESEGRHRQLFEAASDAVFLIDNATGRIIDANNAASALYGYDKHELLAKKNTDLPAEPEETQRAARETPVSPDQAEAVALRLHRKKDGTVFPVEITGGFFTWEGRPVHLISIRDITERRRIEGERKLVSRRIMHAREEEKRRFATVLHDAIGAMVVGLSSSLLITGEEIRHGGGNRAIAELARTKKMVKGLAVMMKKVCVDIWPPAMEISGLPGALSALLPRFCSGTKIKTCHSIDLPDDGRKADNLIEIVIYRLVQEALHNAAKHSRARNLELIINQDDTKAMISISDDGCGFDTDKLRLKRSSLGLRIMREDAESVGGKLMIDSKPGRGTVIKAELPLRLPPDLRLGS